MFVDDKKKLKERPVSTVCFGFVRLVFCFMSTFPSWRC